MKSGLPLLALSLIFASCTTAYKSGQTPDDVYFSPARPQSEYVRQDDQEENRYYRDEESYRDDRYLRLKIRDHRYASLYDDYYSYNPYYYHYYNGSLNYNSPWSTYGYWNNYYNPSYSHVIIVNPKRPVINRPRTFDLSVYNPQPAGSLSTKGRTVPSSNRNSTFGSTNSDNYRGRGTSAGGFLREVFNGAGSSNSSSSRSSAGSEMRSSSSSSRSTSTPSSTPSSSGSSSSNAPARKF